MRLILKAVFILLCSSCLPLVTCADQDSILFGKSISEDHTIVSSGGVFALGFFRPAGNLTKNRYVGIWYNNIPEKTVVWVANREDPINTSSKGSMNITGDGNLVVINGDNLILWSSNVTKASVNTTARLLNSGNLVLRVEAEGREIWQSFDHPTDTLLPGMKLRFNFKTRIEQRIFAWKTSTDPSPGDLFVSFDPNSPFQVVLWRGYDVVLRLGVWKEQTITSREPNGSSIMVQTTVVNDEEIYYTYAGTEVFAMVRMFIDPIGRLNQSIWINKMKSWFHNSSPRLPCNAYNICGSFSMCDETEEHLSCKCLEGFSPNNQSDGKMIKSSYGCVRKVDPKCDGSDRFVKITGVEFPDHFLFQRNVSEDQCKAKCLDNCKCTAYAYVNVSNVVVTDLRCFTWYEELKDMTYNSVTEGEFYVRIASYDSSSKKKDRILPISLPTVIAVIIMIIIFFFRRRLKAIGWLWAKTFSKTFHSKMATVIASEIDVIETPALSFDSILKATDSFSVANKLGEGGFGPVFKGRMLDGLEIAVKMLSKSSGQGLQEFKTEVELISKLQHANLVRLVGWCAHEEERILVYEFLPNLSLDKYLFDSTLSQGLNWDKRYNIIEGIAQGLLYLHKYSRLRVIHRDLKCSNILLDEEMNPKIADFGLARIFGEYALGGIFSEKSDVFSFGVIVLEVITGKRSTGLYPYKESVNLLGYLSQLWEEGRGLEIIDKHIENTYATTSQVMKCMQIGLLCVEDNPADRPSMSSVVTMLSTEIVTLPIPRHPAFAFRRHVDLSSLNSSTSHLTEAATSEPTK